MWLKIVKNNKNWLLWYLVDDATCYTVVYTLEKYKFKKELNSKKYILNDINHLKSVIFKFVKDLSYVKNKIFTQISILE